MRYTSFTYIGCMINDDLLVCYKCRGNRLFFNIPMKTAGTAIVFSFKFLPLKKRSVQSPKLNFAECFISVHHYCTDEQTELIFVCVLLTYFLKCIHVIKCVPVKYFIFIFLSLNTVNCIITCSNSITFYAMP